MWSSSSLPGWGGAVIAISTIKALRVITLAPIDRKSITTRLRLSCSALSSSAAMPSSMRAASRSASRASVRKGPFRNAPPAFKPLRTSALAFPAVSPISQLMSRTTRARRDTGAQGGTVFAIDLCPQRAGFEFGQTGDRRDLDVGIGRTGGVPIDAKHPQGHPARGHDLTGVVNAVPDGLSCFAVHQVHVAVGVVGVSCRNALQPGERADRLMYFRHGAPHLENATRRTANGDVVGGDIRLCDKIFRVIVIGAIKPFVKFGDRLPERLVPVRQVHSNDRQGQDGPQSDSDASERFQLGHLRGSGASRDR